MGKEASPAGLDVTGLGHKVLVVVLVETPVMARDLCVPSIVNGVGRTCAHMHAQR